MKDHKELFEFEVNLKEMILDRIKYDLIEDQTIINKLDILPVGLDVLYGRHWTVSESMNILFSLGYKIDCLIKRYYE